jgi:hypothetical protein
LEHQTSGTFRKIEIKKWVRANCNDDDGTHENPLWLDENQVNLMLDGMPNYFKQAAMVQWAGGFRAEEVAMLQREKCCNDVDVRIEVDALFDGGELYWKPKTRRSYGKVHLPDFARKTIMELLAARKNDFLLFPNDAALHGGRKAHNTGGNKLWRGEAWTTAYLEALRTGVRAANAKGANIDMERLDSRTLRRSAGKRILLQSGYDLKLTAAILRDRPETVEKHYASIRPEDVRQPDR